MTFVACDSGEGTLCAGTSDPNAEWCYQISHSIPSANPCPSASTVTWTWNSDSIPCADYRPFGTACETQACEGVLKDIYEPRKGRPICGCR